MAGVFLGGPFLSGLSEQCGWRCSEHDLFETRRGASQADAEVRVLLQRKGEIKLAFKPGRDLDHRTYIHVDVWARLEKAVEMRDPNCHPQLCQQRGLR